MQGTTNAACRCDGVVFDGVQEPPRGNITRASIPHIQLERVNSAQVLLGRLGCDEASMFPVARTAVIAAHFLGTELLWLRTSCFVPYVGEIHHNISSTFRLLEMPSALHSCTQ